MEGYTFWFSVIVTVAAASFFIPKFLSSNAKDQSEENANPPRVNYRRLPIGRVSLEELSKYTGHNNERVLISICGHIFDMTSGGDFYGPGGPYNLFAGKDATYCLSTMSIEPQNCNKKEFSLDESEKETLESWLSKFIPKYPIVGFLQEFENVGIEVWNQIRLKHEINNINVEKLPEISLEQLSQSKNEISLCGYVYDISPAIVVYEHYYGDFNDSIGHDISVALLQSKYDPKYLNKTLNDIEDPVNSKKILKSLEKKYQETYTMVGKLKEKEYHFNDELGDDWDVLDYNNNE